MMALLRGRFTRRGGGAIVHFDHPPIPDVIRFAGADWRAKREFHVTLAGTTMMRALTADADEMIKRAARRQAFRPKCKSRSNVRRITSRFTRSARCAESVCQRARSWRGLERKSRVQSGLR